MIVTIGGLLMSCSDHLSVSRIDWRSALSSVSIFICAVSFSTLTSNSVAMSIAVSKSRFACAQIKILFESNTFMTSGSGTPIFSENSFTVIESLIVMTVFFFKLSETLYAFSLFGVVDD